jgi:hypothetical protein
MAFTTRSDRGNGGALAANRTTPAGVGPGRYEVVPDRGLAPGVKAPFNTTMDHLKFKATDSPGPGEYDTPGALRLLDGGARSQALLGEDFARAQGAAFRSTSSRFHIDRSSNLRVPGCGARAAPWRPPPPRPARCCRRLRRAR